MGNDIGTGVLFKSVCFDLFSTYVGNSVIKTRTSNGSDDITHLWAILVPTKIFLPSPILKIWRHLWMAPIGSGSDFLYGPHRAMNESIVLVTINYRLGPFGFLSGGDCPLNIGLHDQRWALGPFSMTTLVSDKVDIFTGWRDIPRDKPWAFHF